MPRYEANYIVDAKLSRPLGSKWDIKPIGKNRIPAVELRYRVGQEVIGNGKTVSQVARELGVSKGFVSKWKKKYQAYRVAKVRRRDVTMDMFKSTSSCPKQGLNYIEFIDSGRAMEVDDSWFYVDPAVAAANVISLMTEKYGIPEDQAIVRFMKSNTFHIITEDQSVAQLPAEDLLNIYEKEVENAR